MQVFRAWAGKTNTYCLTETRLKLYVPADKGAEPLGRIPCSCVFQQTFLQAPCVLYFTLLGAGTGILPAHPHAHHSWYNNLLGNVSRRGTRRGRNGPSERHKESLGLFKISELEETELSLAHSEPLSLQTFPSASRMETAFTKAAFSLLRKMFVCSRWGSRKRSSR